MAIIAVMTMVIMGMMVTVNPITADGPTGSITKSMDYVWFRLGERATVTLDVSIIGGSLTVEDPLPDFISYISGTFKVDGILTDPDKAGPVVAITLPAGSYVITFEVIYDSSENYQQSGENIAYLKDGKDIVATSNEVKVTGEVYCGFHKEFVHLSGELKVGQEIQWKLRMWIHNLGYLGFDIEDAVIMDRLGAELELDDAYPPEPIDPVLITAGEWKYWTKGQSKKVSLKWYDVDVESGHTETFEILVSTDLNPSGKQEYTTSGCYDLNSGGVIKFKTPDGIQLSAHTEQISVYIAP